MENILISLFPIFLLIILGYILKKLSFPSLEFWEYSDKFTYYILFPALFVFKLSTAKLTNIDGFSFIIALFLAIFLMSIILIFFSKIFFSFSGSSFTSIYQGVIRFNSYVFLALSDVVFGDKGLVLAALLMTFAIPLINILCILIFSIYTANTKITLASLLKLIIKNPLIVSCIIGGLFNFFDIRLFLPFEKTLQLLGSAALPLGLLSVGVGLHIAHIKEIKSELFIALFFKLTLFPIVMFLVARFFTLDYETTAFLVLFAALPTASSSYILARELGGDLKLMSAIISLQTIISIFSISILYLYLIYRP